MEIEDGVEHDNIEAHILARTTAEQERKTRWVRCALALLVGVSFPNSAWYVYVIQVLGLAGQGWGFYSLITYAAQDWAQDDDKNDEEQTPAPTPVPTTGDENGIQERDLEQTYYLLMIHIPPNFF